MKKVDLGLKYITPIALQKRLLKVERLEALKPLGFCNYTTIIAQTDENHSS